MSYLIDRRLNAKNKSTVNRQRFLRRYQKHIKEAVADAMTRHSVTDIGKSEKISIPSDDIKEPVFGHGPGGKRTIVNSGNKEFIAGDRLKRSTSGSGGAGGQASDSGEGEDEFVFQISQSEFLQFMFEDLELPNLVKRQLIGTDSFKYRHAGCTTVGNPNQINVVRTLRQANARRIALGGRNRKTLRKLQKEILLLESSSTDNDNSEAVNRLKIELDTCKAKLSKLPFIDTFDLRYNLRVKEPVPTSKAVMFCIMDVSGSMDQNTKEMAKRFFILLYLFLQRNYDRTEVVFVRHHTSAKEVDEQEFFHSRETGGTVVSSALRMMNDIISERFDSNEWNIYGAQASDGDNWNNDSNACHELLTERIMPQCQYYSYIEITPNQHQALWHEYQQVKLQFEDTFAMRQIVDPSDIYPVFRELFQRRSV